LDVCLGFRLRVDGHSIKLDDVFMESKGRELLNNEIVDVEMLCDFLRRCTESVNPEDYYRLYIVLGSLFQVAREQFFPCYLPLLMTLVVLANTIGADLFMNS